MDVEVENYDSQCVEIGQINAVTSFDNISLFLHTHKYPDGLNLNQKRTLRKAAINFCMEEGKLYYIGKNKNEKRLVIEDDERKRQIFLDCHSLDSNLHCGQKKTLEKMESLFFWRRMVKDVVTWIQSCDLCREREEKRLSSSSKRPRQVDQPSEGPYLCPLVETEVSTDDALPDITQQASAEYPSDSIYSPDNQLKLLDRYEQEIAVMADKTELNIDDAMDHLHSIVIKCITKRRRELKAKASILRANSLSKVKLAKVEVSRVKCGFSPDDEDINIHSNVRNMTCLSKNGYITLPPRRHFEGVWSTFNVNRICRGLDILISSAGEIHNIPPNTVAQVVQVPAGVRIFASNVAESSIASSEGNIEPSRLRLAFRPHIPGDPNFHIDESSVKYFKRFNNETQSVCYVSGLQPHQMYEFYLSHQDEGSTQWSPWSYPYLASTALPSFSWDPSSNDWHVSADLREATKRINSVTPLFLSSPQFFPGCKICVEVLKREVTKYSEEGLALVQPWVQFSSLCQEGTLFLNLAGQLFLDGKFVHSFAPPDSTKTTLTLESSSVMMTETEGIRIQLCVSYHSEICYLDWNLRSDGENCYVGIQLNTQGSLAKII